MGKENAGQAVPPLQGRHVKEVGRCNRILADRPGRQRACGQDHGLRRRNRTPYQGAFQSCQLGAFGEEGARLPDEAVPVRRAPAVGQFRRHVRQARSRCREREDGTGRRPFHTRTSSGLPPEGCTGASTARPCRYWAAGRLILFPDLKATEEWRQRLPMLESFCRRATCSDMLERIATGAQRDSQGLDIADFLLMEDTPQMILATDDRTQPRIADIHRRFRARTGGCWEGEMTERHRTARCPKGKGL